MVAEPAYLNVVRTQELPGILWLVQDPSLLSVLLMNFIKFWSSRDRQQIKKLQTNIQLPAHKLFSKKQINILFRCKRHIETFNIIGFKNIFQ